MKKLTILSLFIILFSCNSKKKQTGYIILYPDSTNYEYYPYKNNVQKVVRFFPDTKDTSLIYFLDTKHNIKVNFLLGFDKTGWLKYKIRYKDSMKIRICTDFYKNRKIKEKYTIINGQLQGDHKYFYKNGRLKAIKEILLYKNIKVINNLRIYKETGEFNQDSTFYVELISDKDTISVNDSLKINFKVLGPNNGGYTCYFGTIDEYINKTDYNKVEFIKTNGYFYFKPKHQGINKINLVFEIFYTSETNSPFRKIFCVKDIYVTK